MLTEGAVNARRLGVAVVALAVNEARYVGSDRHARRLRRPARAWIDAAGPSFTFWCEVAGVDPVALRRAVLTGTAKRARKRHPPRAA